MTRFIRNTALSAAIALAAFAIVPAPRTLAQSQSINGTIRGRVSDPSGASIGNATVTIANPSVGFTKSSETAGDGYYVFLNLPLGTYSVTVSHDGFTSQNVENVPLSAGREAVIDASLTVGSAADRVEVSASNLGIDPSTINIQRTIPSREIENAPLTSRNPYNFIIFQPGVSGHPNPELGIPRTINTNGLLDRINYQLDGMINVQSDRYGLRLFPIGNIFVKEVQTISNSVSPEFGWTAGDVYNVISNSGTNDFHGLFQWIHRWQDATAYPLLSTSGSAKPNLQLNDYSVNAGGPALKDKLFFFGSYEQLKRGQPVPVTITAANAALIGLAPSELATANGLLNGKFADGRVDWHINQRNQAFIRYNYFKNTFPQNTQVGGINATSAGVDFSDRAHVIGFQLISTLSDHMVNEFRFSWPLRSSQHFAGSYTGTGPAIVITNVAAFNGTSNAGDNFTEKVPSGSDNISYVRGSHTIKAGVIYSQILDKQRLQSFNRYTFATPAAYLAAKNGTNPRSYTLYESQNDVNGVGYASSFYGAFAQDTWQLTPRLIAIYGARYDRFASPRSNPNAPFIFSRTFNVPNTNFAPRLGFTYRLDDTTYLKASGGIFYSQTPTNVWFNALNLDGSNRTSSISFQPNAAGSPAFPNVPAANTATPQSVTSVSPNFKNEYTWNFQAQLAHSFSQNDSFTLGYILANGRNLMYLHNINPINPIGSLADGRPVFSPTANANTRRYTQFNQVNVVETGANSSFNALVAEFSHNLTRGIQFRAGYTWSHTISDAPEVNSFEQNLPIQDTTNLKRDRGNGFANRPNAFNASAVMEPEFKLNNRFANETLNHNMVTILANFSSGDQSSIIASNGQLNGDTSVAAVTRPAFVSRNTVRSPSVYQVDARYTRTFPKIYDRIAPSFLIEANNVFNHSNITGIATTQAVTAFNPAAGANNANAGVATAAAPVVTRSTVLEARIVQFGLAVRW